MFSMHPKYLGAILSNSFTIDFAEITLTPKMPGLPTYKGSGTVSQDDKGSLSLKMHHALSRDMYSAMHLAIENRASTPGKLIPEKFYLQFKATDPFGDTWTSEIPPISTVGGIINEDLQQIEHIKEMRENMMRDSESILMIIPRKYKIPCNMPNGVCTINMNGIKVKIQNEENHTIIQASRNKGRLPENFERRFIEVLSVFLGSLIFPIYFENIYIESEKAAIWSNMSNCNNQEIIPIRHPYDWEVDSFRNFIECYLRTFEKVNQPFFTYWHRIHAALQSGYADNQALIVCISIEGIIKEYYQEYGMKICSGAEQEKKQNRKTKKRRPIKILLEMAQDGIFEEQLARDWKELRDASAHADTADRMKTNEELQNYLNKINSCLHLFHILLFHKIGYTGNYVNYSKDGWPLDSFPRKNEPDSCEANGEDGES